jgi:hypothetical protein
MRRKKRLLAASVLVWLSAVLAAPTAWALDGVVTHLSGAVVARRADGQARILSVRSEVREGDIVLTSDNTYARIKWGDGTDIVLRPNTQLKIDTARYTEGKPEEDGFAISLLKGGLRSVTGLLGKRSPAAFKLSTPTATVGIRGTHFGALFCNRDCQGIQTVAGEAPADGLHIDVSDGEIVVTTEAGAVDFRIGDFGYVQNLSTLPILVPPAQGTRITPPPMVLSLTIQGSSVGRAGDNECTVR